MTDQKSKKCLKITIFQSTWWPTAQNTKTRYKLEKAENSKLKNVLKDYQKKYFLTSAVILNIEQRTKSTEGYFHLILLLQFFPLLYYHNQIILLQSAHLLSPLDSASRWPSSIVPSSSNVLALRLYTDVCHTVNEKNLQCNEISEVLCFRSLCALN